MVFLCIPYKKLNLCNLYIDLIKDVYNIRERYIDENENYLCLIAGNTIRTYFSGGFMDVFNFVGWFFLTLAYNYGLEWFWVNPRFVNLIIAAMSFAISVPFIYIYQFLYYLYPFPVGIQIELGGETAPARGWVYTNGLSGIKSWNGSFKGKVLGFTGIKIYEAYHPVGSAYEYSFMGFAPYVKIEYVESS